MIKLSDLKYNYPEDLVATEPQWPPRVLLNDGAPREVTFSQLKDHFRSGDVLVINDTKVVKRRLFSAEGLEILFLEPLGNNNWKVLFPASRVKNQQSFLLPDSVEMKLVARGLPQRVEVSKPLSEDYFNRHGEMALPPYIQKARGQRHSVDEDEAWYQSSWAEKNGSTAAPTASLHFKLKDLHELEAKGVEVVKVTLHVGLGTFLPIKQDNLSEHKMHSEWAEITNSSLEKIKNCRGKVSCLGTTATRVVESWAHGKLSENEHGFSGDTDLFITPGFNYKVTDRLLTNFHQPESTLLALVGAFAGLDNVKKAYEWAIERKFRLFSYGDLSVWEK